MSGKNKNLYPRDTPLVHNTKRYGKPFVIRWWYNRFDAISNMHVLDHIFYDHTKWRQDEVLLTENEARAKFTKKVTT